MKILFLHGWHSVVGGVKPTHLQHHGHEVANPALDDDSFEQALATAQAEFDRFQPQVVVGSSRGGAVADIYRLRGGKVVEHWDVLQPIPAESANPHPMF